MRIFDRRFLQYQLAYGVWFNLKSRFLFVAMVLAALTFFTNNFMYLILVPFLYTYGYFKLHYLLNVSDKKFHKRMEKQYKFYESKNAKANGKYAFQLEKSLFAVEMEKLSVDDAIEDINAILKTRPKMAKIANGMLLSIHLVGRDDGNIKEIPPHLINSLDFALVEEENPNVLLDYVRMSLKLGKYDMAIKLLDRTEEKSKLYKRQRFPVLQSIYQTALVAIPFYRSIALGHRGELEEASIQLQKAIKNSKSKKLKEEMQKQGEELKITLLS